MVLVLQLLKVNVYFSINNLKLLLLFVVDFEIGDDIQDREDENDLSLWELSFFISWIIFFPVSILFLMLSQHVDFVSAVCIYLCLTLTVSTYWKDYNLSTPIEYIGVAVCYFYHIPITFPMFSCFKMIVSLIICIVEIGCCPSDDVVQLKYLIRHPWKSCHAYISAGNDVYYSSFIEGHESKATSILTKSFFAPCVGLGILTTREKILEKLYLCGKCHDWAVVALHLLSTQKYLTYSILCAYRWTSWIILVVALGTFGLDKYFDNNNLPTEVHILISLPDVLLLLVTLFDVTNFRKERLDDNRTQGGVEYLHRGSLFDGSKLLALFFLLFAFCTRVNDPHHVAKFGYIIYFLSSVVASVTAHFLFTRLGLKVKTH